MENLTRRGFIVLSAATLLSGCSAYTFATSTGPSALTPETMAARINEIRRVNGRKPVVWNPRLATAARTQAQLMASRDQMSHELGGKLRARVTAAGYAGAVGENLAGGYKTLEGAIQGWLDSPGHRATLLSPNFTEFGLATASVGGGRKSRYGTYWCLIMGGAFEPWLKTQG